jgi:hypothetical protein
MRVTYKFNTAQYNQLLINTYFKAKPFKLQFRGYGEVQNFNSV